MCSHGELAEGSEFWVFGKDRGVSLYIFIRSFIVNTEYSRWPPHPLPPPRPTPWHHLLHPETLLSTCIQHTCHLFICMYIPWTLSLQESSLKRPLSPLCVFLAQCSDHSSWLRAGFVRKDVPLPSWWLGQLKLHQANCSWKEAPVWYI